MIKWPPKDPNSVEPYFAVWCDKTGLNDGSSSDNGELQSATISTVTWTYPSGITKDSDNKSAVTINGTSYAVNTVCTIWLSGGTSGTRYVLRCTITTSDSRTLSEDFELYVE